LEKGEIAGVQRQGLGTKQEVIPTTMNNRIRADTGSGIVDLPPQLED
jgi:hypothetical protein